MRLSIAFTFLLLRSLWAQNTTGTILGTVRDASGAVIPGAKVTVTNENTNIPASLLTSSSGDFVVPNLMASQ